MPKIISTAETHRSIPQVMHPNALSPSEGGDGKALANMFKDSIEGNNRSTTIQTVAPLATEIKIPNQAIEHIVNALARSRKILSLPYDWDEAGSAGYAEVTWERAKDFLLNNAKQLWLKNQIRIDTPKILPGPDGSIDILWKTAQRELLVNIPEQQNESANYYGDDKNSQIVKGSLDTSADNRWLLMWLMQ